MAESSITLNAGVGGSSVAGYQDTGAKFHQEVVIQTQGSGADPVSVSAVNPIPANVTGNVGSGSTDAGNGVKVAGVYNSSAPTLTTGNRADFQTDVNGNLKVNIAAGSAAGGTSSTVSASFPSVATAVGFSDGTNMKPGLVDGSGNLKVNIAAGGVAAATDNSAFTAGSSSGLPFMAVFNDSISNAVSGDVAVPRMTVTRQLLTAQQAAVAGGWSPFRLVSAATTNATSVKGSAGSVGVVVVGNVAATVAYLKFYNKASAPTVGTDTPVFIVPIPGNTAGAGASVPMGSGLSFSTGIAFAVTGLLADSDTTAVAANNVSVSLGFL